MKGLLKGKKTVLVVIGVVLFALLLIFAPALRKSVNKGKSGSGSTVSGEKPESTVSTVPSKVVDTGVTGGTGTDKYLIQSQPRLKERFGEPPEGYIINQDGTFQSIGDLGMSSEDVLYAYVRALSLLDFSTVQKFSRNSKVLKTYNEYFNSKSTNADYKEAFTRKVYKEGLLSIEVLGVDNQAVFANNKIVYTVKLKMLDLTDKDFWLEDKDTVFKELSLIDSEGDSTKSEQYIYDYTITKYSENKDKLTREILVDVTLEKFADLGSGWLVSIDSDLDNAFKYKDGKIFATYVLEMFREYKAEQRSGGTK